MSPLQTATQVSSGGVAFRLDNGQIVIALILVGPRARWQLPKGTVDQDESNEDAALREVREEAGIEAELLAPLDRIEYWFYASRSGQKVRFHKYVYFYLMRYCSGDVADHDHEVEEARWVEINHAIEMLAFESEKEMVRKARERILSGEGGSASDTYQTETGGEAERPPSP